VLRLLIDAQSLNDRIGGINGAGNIGEYLLKLVNDKTVLRPPSPVPAPSNTGGTATNGTESVGSPKSEQKEPKKQSDSSEKEDAPVETAAKTERQSSEKS
jgi:hypothetical protein